MKILAIGDFHGKFPVKLQKLVKSVDLVLCTGDLGGSDKLLKIIFKYFEEGWYNIVGEKKAKQYIMEDYNSGKKVIGKLNSLGKMVHLISGNWDFSNNAKVQRTGRLKLKPYPAIIKKMKNLKLYNRTYRKIGGLSILFFGNFVTSGAYLDRGVRAEKDRKRYVKKNKEEIKHIMKYSKRPVDILLAHYPAYGYFDKVRYKGGNPMNGKHVGFKGYTKFIEKNRPALFICGHMHEYQGKKKMGDTLIVATGAAHDGKAAVIDFDEEKGRVKNVRFVK
jgi:Icc-related predicted phosphoesterase